MKVYSQLEKARLENVSSAEAAGSAGRIIYRTDKNAPEVDTGAEYDELVTRNRMQTIIEDDGLASVKDWVTATDYVIGDKVVQGNNFYNCIVNHTAGTFATDLTSNYWAKISNYDTEIATLTTDSATRTELSIHEASSGGVHGVSGAVVGTEGAQFLNNKTLEASCAFQGSIESPTRADVKKDTKANLETYAATATNGQMCFATDEKKMYHIVDNVLTSVGGGGSLNITTLGEEYEITGKTITVGSDTFQIYARTFVLNDMIDEFVGAYFVPLNPIGKTNAGHWCFAGIWINPNTRCCLAYNSSFNTIEWSEAGSVPDMQGSIQTVEYYKSNLPL